MKRFKHLFLALALLASVSSAWADANGTCGTSLTWSYNSTDHSLTISGSGAMKLYYSHPEVPWKSYRANITTVSLSNEMTSISGYAFYCCTALTSITIPAGVTSIPNDAFYGCTSLQTVNLPEDMTGIGPGAFQNCTSLESITIPTTVTTINNSAFKGCTGLTEITISNSIKNLGQYAFSGCTNLTSITLPHTGSIGMYAFEDCTSLTSVTITGSTNTISNSAFKGCTGLTSVTLPDNLTTIIEHAFEGCSGLTSITLPSTVQYIYGEAFKDCSALADIYVNWTGTPPTPTSDAFTNIAPGATLHVRHGTSGNYTAAVWAAFNIEENPGGQCGDALFWEYDPSTGELTITGSGDMYNTYGINDAPWKDYRGQITSVVLPEGMTSIGKNAFYQCSALTSINIPANVASMGDKVFYYCTSLETVTFAAGNQLTGIGTQTFNGCTSLTSINIPATVESIGQYAFFSCSALTSITIPTNVESIGQSAFHSCSNLTSITIPAGVTGIEKSTFYGCSALTSITIPAGVTSIGNNVFYNCTSLTSINIPNTVTSIGNYAFYGCSALTSITIPAGVPSIGNSVFYNCTNLATVTFEAGSQLTSIGNGAFEECTGLTSITIPAGVTNIGETAFWNCGGLTSIDIPNSVTGIGNYAFSKCSGLTTLTIPSNVTGIGNGAFYQCTGLTEVNVSWTDLSSVNTNTSAFSGVTTSGVDLNIPDGTYYQYVATAPWSGFNIVYTPADYVITANPDPNDPSTYYSTFYDGYFKYVIPANVEAYVAALSGETLTLAKIAEAGQTLPEATAVILKATTGSFTLVPSDADAVTFTATNNLHGVDVATPVATAVTSGTCYVLSGKASDDSETGVGFYQFTGTTLGAHKAYAVLDGGAALAPQHLRFVFDETTDIESPSLQGRSEEASKILRDGVLYIKRGEHIYNAQGQMIK